MRDLLLGAVERRRDLAGLVSRQGATGHVEAECLGVGLREPHDVRSEYRRDREEPLVGCRALEGPVVVGELLGVTELVIGQPEDELHRSVDVAVQAELDRRVRLTGHRVERDVPDAQCRHGRDEHGGVVERSTLYPFSGVGLVGSFAAASSTGLVFSTWTLRLVPSTTESWRK